MGTLKMKNKKALNEIRLTLDYLRVSLGNAKTENRKERAFESFCNRIDALLPIISQRLYDKAYSLGARLMKD